MDGDSCLWLLGVILLLLACSACFSVCAAAFSHVNRLRLKSLAEAGNEQAAAVFALVEPGGALLPSIQMGRDMANICAAAVAAVLFGRLWGGLGAVVSVAVLAAVTLLLGVLLPQIWVRGRAEAMAMRLLWLSGALTTCFRPLCALAEWLGQRLSRPVRPGAAEAESEGWDADVMEEELRLLVDKARSDGGFDESESSLIRSAIGFGELEISDILTPRVDMVAVEDTASRDEIDRVFRETGFSRLPVYHEHIDGIVGVIYEKDFFANRANFTIERYLKTIPLVSPGMKISALLQYLQKNRIHLAVVMDEYGSVSGLVSLEDIVEELVGEIWDEHDEIVEDFRPLPGGACEVNGSLSLGKLFGHYGIRGESDSATVSGWVSEALGKLAAVGDEFERDGLCVTVTEVENRRVQKIRVVRCDVAKAVG